MKFYCYASFVTSECGIPASGWNDEREIVVRSNSKKNARQKIINWAKHNKNIRAVQWQLWFCTKKLFFDPFFGKQYKTTYLK